MKEKWIIMSKKLVFENNNTIKKNFDSFHKKVVEQNINIIVVTNEAAYLSNKLDNYKMCETHNRKTVRKSLKEFEDRNELGIVILGVVDEDATLAFNNKIPLFKPGKSYLGLSVDIENKVDNYGIELTSTQDLIDYINIISSEIKPFLQHDFSDKYTMISLFNANTMGNQTEENKKYKEEIKKILKSNTSENIDKTRMLNVFNFLLLSECFNNPMLKEVKYWGTFPSSDKNNDNTTISHVKEVTRKVLNRSKKGEEILIRTKTVPKKHLDNTNGRVQKKCQTDFESIKINDYYKNKLQGSIVCIVDDYTTYGFSAESAKNLLLKAGVKKLIVITLGKYGQVYNEVNYELIGDLYEGEYRYNLINSKKHTIRSNNERDDYLKCIKEVIEI